LTQKTIPFDEYRARVLGCWLGKAVGGTLGGPYEGVLTPLDLKFYDPIPDTMLPNDDLDLQVVWAEAIRAHGLPIHRRLLADAWMQHIQLWPDEYGVANRNLRAGIYPPASGAYDNGFTAGMGAAIRTELWACLAPGDPELACALMREDACVDHGPDGEGMYAAVYLAYLESAAFVERDRETLLEGAQKTIPADCRVARAIADTRRWWAETGDWKNVFTRITAEHGNQNFTDVAQNLAFTILGWLAGKDFGEALCIAVNCGQDTDCTGATLGALLGILNPEGIGEEWLKPIGRNMVLSPGMVGMHAPATLDEFTDQVAGLAVAVQEYYGASLRLDTVPEEVQTAAAKIPLRFPDYGPEAARALLIKPDTTEEESLLSVEPLIVKLTYPAGVALVPDIPSSLTVTVENPLKIALTDVELTVSVPDGWDLSEAGKHGKFDLGSGESRDFSLTITPPADVARTFGNPLDLDIRLGSVGGLVWRVSAGLPLTLPWRIAPDTRPAGSLDESCPTLPGEALICETPGHYIPIPGHGEHGDDWLFESELELPYHVNARFVLQTPKGAAVRAWLDGELLHAHEGGYQVPAIHRSGPAGKSGLFKRGWHRLTIAVHRTTPLENDNGKGDRLFVGMGDAASWDWVHGVEWRVPCILSAGK
jgi:ADP-ribosylglycohydrolase